MSLLVEELKKAEQARRENLKAGRAEELATVHNVFAVRQQPESNPSGWSRTIPIAAGLLIILATTVFGVYSWLLSPPPAGRLPTVPATQSDAIPAQAPGVSVPPVVATRSSLGKDSDPTRIPPARLGLNPALKRGYEAYLAGKLSIASSEYQQVLIKEPKNMDALLGLAAISLRQAEPDAAEGFYLRAIEVNPQNVLAQAGLIGIKGQRDPLQAESRLKAMLAAQPELSFLNIALGNLYASQNRWSEAQQSFYKAYIVEPDNPDTLFDLAVSVDQMRQPGHAVQYYKQALVAAEKRPASFDKLKVSARLRELQHYAPTMK